MALGVDGGATEGAGRAARSHHIADLRAQALGSVEIKFDGDGLALALALRGGFRADDDDAARLLVQAEGEASGTNIKVEVRLKGEDRVGFPGGGCGRWGAGVLEGGLDRLADGGELLLLHPDKGVGTAFADGAQAEAALSRLPHGVGGEMLNGPELGQGHRPRSYAGGAECAYWVGRGDCHQPGRSLTSMLTTHFTQL